MHIPRRSAIDHIIAAEDIYRIKVLPSKHRVQDHAVRSSRVKAHPGFFFLAPLLRYRSYSSVLYTKSAGLFYKLCCIEEKDCMHADALKAIPYTRDKPQGKESKGADRFDRFTSRSSTSINLRNRKFFTVRRVTGVLPQHACAESRRLLPFILFNEFIIIYSLVEVDRYTWMGKLTFSLF